MKNKDNADVMILRSKVLYEKANKDLNNDFTKYYDWIAREINRIKYMKKYSKFLKMDQFESGMKNKSRRQKQSDCAQGTKFSEHFIVVE